MSEIDIPVSAQLVRDIRDGIAEADILVELMRAAGVNHTHDAITFILVSDDVDIP